MTDQDQAVATWIAASTHAHKEPMAITNLERQGFNAYCPMIKRRVRHARKLSEVLRPLFPGYVFIRLDLDRDQWRPIMSTFGVRNLIRFGDRLGALPSAFVETLLAREQDGAVTLPPAKAAYAPGEQVRLREGPFEGLVATVLTASDCDRLLVLMDLLKRSVRVKVAIEDVIPA